ncbi:MAG TPA: hypothetical protein VMH00_00685 [Candidatus Limnocylindrales bacterium]|nr:hypothetical protein [Candidatus Limnocylindrales bacterium]
MNVAARFQGMTAAGNDATPRWTLPGREPKQHAERHGQPVRWWIVRLVRNLSYRVRLAATAPTLEQVETRELELRNQRSLQLAEEYSRGYMAGWQECFETCLETVEDEIAQADDLWNLGRSLTGSVRKDN